MAKERKSPGRTQSFTFGRKNLYILGIGLALLVIGYILMVQPPVNGFVSLTLSPIILLIGYLVVIPYAILYGIGKDKGTEAQRHIATGDPPRRKGTKE
jgi:hypothetical protein